MKKLLRITGITAIVFVIILSIIGLWQKDNVLSFIYAMQYSNNQINDKMTDHKKEMEDALFTYTKGTIRDLSVEEEEQIRRGEITPEQAIDKIKSESTNKVNSTETVASPKPTPNPVDKVINDHISQLYLIKAQYIGTLGNFENRVLSYFNSLPQKNNTTKQATISKFLGELTAMESDCDAKVNQVLSSLETQLKELNADTSIVKTIKKAYTDEKNLKKSYFINSYR